MRVTTALSMAKMMNKQDLDKYLWRDRLDAKVAKERRRRRGPNVITHLRALAARDGVYAGSRARWPEDDFCWSFSCRFCGWSDFQMSHRSAILLHRLPLPCMEHACPSELSWNHYDPNDLACSESDLSSDTEIVSTLTEQASLGSLDTRLDPDHCGACADNDKRTERVHWCDNTEAERKAEIVERAKKN